MDVVKSGFETPLRIDYRPPAWLVVYLVVVNLAGIVSVCITGLPAPGKFILVVILVACLALELYKLIKLAAKAQTIGLDSRGGWSVKVEGKAQQTAELVSVSILRPEFILLRLKLSEGKCQDFILTAKDIDKNTLRRLRVRLNFPLS